MHRGYICIFFQTSTYVKVCQNYLQVTLMRPLSKWNKFSKSLYFSLSFHPACTILTTVEGENLWPPKQMSYSQIHVNGNCCCLGFPKQEYEVGYHFLPQGIFPTQGLNPHLLHCRQILYCCTTWKVPCQIIICLYGWERTKNLIVFLAEQRTSVALVFLSCVLFSLFLDYSLCWLLWSRYRIYVYICIYIYMGELWGCVCLIT